MKKSLSISFNLLLFLVLFCLDKANAENHDKSYFPTNMKCEKAMYYITTSGALNAPGFDLERREYCVAKDTTIGDLLYQIIRFNENGYGTQQLLVRNEGNKIYCKYPASMYINNNQSEVLLFDFDLTTGDTISNPYSGESVVLKTDSVQLYDGRMAKRIIYDKYRSPDIEYIGNSTSFIPLLQDLNYQNGNDICDLNTDLYSKWTVGDEVLFCIEHCPAMCELLLFDMHPCYNEHTYLLESLAWRYKIIDMSCDKDTIKTSYTKIGIEKDTVIDGIAYIKMGSYYVRENNKRIYCRMFNEKSESFEDVLMYDFSLETGDSIIMNNEYLYGFENENENDNLPRYAYVTGIEQAKLNYGEPVKLIHYDIRPDDIEYVGSIGGFFSPIESKIIPTCTVVNFICCSLRGFPLWEKYLGSCTEIITNTDIKQISVFEITKSADNLNNQFQKIIQNGSLYIVFPDGRHFDATGREIK